MIRWSYDSHTVVSGHYFSIVIPGEWVGKADRANPSWMKKTPLKYKINSKAMIAKPIEVKPLMNYKIFIKYDDNVSGEIDLSHLAFKGVFEAWKDEIFFKKVYIDKETYAIAWDETIELCPNTLYLRLLGKSFEDWQKEEFVHGSNQ